MVAFDSGILETLRRIHRTGNCISAGMVHRGRLLEVVPAETYIHTSKNIQVADVTNRYWIHIE